MSALDELEILASTIRGYGEREFGSAQPLEPGIPCDGLAAARRWRAIARDLGVGALLIDEEYGGAGATLIEAARVAETLGEIPIGVAYLGSAVLAPVLLSHFATDSALARELLERLADGSAVAAVAWADTDTGTATAQPFVDSTAEEARASGTWRFVIDAAGADRVVLIGDGGHRIALADTADLAITPRPGFDLLRSVSDVTATNAPVTVLATGARARSAFDAMLAAGRIALAAESAGGARAALTEAVDYTKVRVQFGKAIGAFQAIKHLLADCYVDSESAISMARAAAASRATSEPDADLLGAAAAFYCADRFAAIAQTTIQVYGGIGFTIECAAHLYRRRAEAARHLLGDPAALRADFIARCVSGARIERQELPL